MIILLELSALTANQSLRILLWPADIRHALESMRFNPGSSIDLCESLPRARLLNQRRTGPRPPP